MDRQALQERFGILGDSPALRRVLERVRQVAPPDITVLLEGESGVGKELVATAIHGLSRRRHKRLVVVNCGAIPEGLIESELFGAEKGAYTGATDRRTGFFEEADGGTLFLDEIGEMPLQAQVRLLRVLETGQFTRVGGTAALTSDARVVAATNKDLGEEVRAGRFREDLYYRLSTVVLRLPSLRQRQEDIVPLFEAFVARYARQYDATFLRLTPEAAEMLARYNWPGNVRELRNVAEQAVVMVQPEPAHARGGAPAVARRDGRRRARARGAAARRPDRAGAALPGAPGDPGRAARPARAAPAGGARRRRADAPVPVNSALVHVPTDPYAVPLAAAPPGGGLRAARAGTPYDASDTVFEIEDGGDGAPPESIGEVLAQGLPLPTMEEAEAALIAEALRRFDGNRRQSADALGISERTLYRKLKEE